MRKRIFHFLLGTTLLASTSALADVTACDVIHTSDVETLIGRIDKVAGERVNVCAGWCDGMNRSFCSFSSYFGPESLTLSLSLPPYDVSEESARKASRLVSEEDNYATDTREIPGIGEFALWSFRGGKGGPDGGLDVFKADNYHILVRVTGIADDGTALKDAEAVSAIVMSRLDQMPPHDRRGN